MRKQASNSLRLHFCLVYFISKGRTTARAALSLEPPTVKCRVCGTLCGRWLLRRAAIRHEEDDADDAVERAAVRKINGLNLDAIVLCGGEKTRRRKEK